MGGLETRCDILIQGLWEIYTGAIIDVIFVYADADTYKYDPMYRLLACWEKKNNDKKSNHFHEQRKHFSPFVL